MLENQGNSVIFYAHYSTAGVSQAGLTVTVDVYEVARDGTATLVVNDGACTEIGAGLYRYLLAAASVDAAAEYVAVFHTATATVDQQDIPALWVIDRAGVEYLDASIAAVPTAAEIWTSTTRTLTQTAAQVAAVLAGSDITVQRGDTLSVALTGLGNIAARTKLYFTVKVNPSRDPDTAAILKIEETAGLTVVNGAAYTTVANGDITVDDAAAGDVTITVDEAVTALLSVASGLYYDIQMVSAAGVTTLTAGRLTVAADVTRAVS